MQPQIVDLMPWVDSEEDIDLDSLLDIDIRCAKNMTYYYELQGLPGQKKHVHLSTGM